MAKPSPRVKKIHIEDAPAVPGDGVNKGYLDTKFAEVQAQINLLKNVPSTDTSGVTPTTTWTLAHVGTLLPNLLYAIDAGLPTTQASLAAGVAGIELDSTSNVLRVREPVSGAIIGHGFGNVRVVAPTAGARPVFRGDGNNNSYDALAFTPDAGLALFGPSAKPWAMFFVIKQTGVGSNGLMNFRTPGGTVNILGTPGATDGQLYVEQNNGSALVNETVSSATALGQKQVLAVVCRDGAFSVWRNGVKTAQSGVGTIGGLSAPTAFQFLNNPQADTYAILISGAALTDATIVAESTRLGGLFDISVTAPATPTTTIPAYVQRYHQPTGPISTDATQPFGVTLEAGATVLQNLTFGRTAPGATVRTRAELDRQVYYRNNEGGLDSVSYYPNQGAFNNWEAVYRNYPEFLADGVTPDPRNLHVIKDDCIEFIARTRLPDSSDNYRFEMGYIRLAEHIRPGQYMEVCCKWPKNQNSWPVFWTFSNEQIFGTKNCHAAPFSLEIDAFDGFPPDGGQVGSVMVNGTVIYGNYIQDAEGKYYPDPAPYDYPSDLYLANGPEFTAQTYDGNTAVRWFNVAPDVNTTESFHYYALDWRDANTIHFLVDGKIVRTRHVKYSGVIGPNTHYEGSPAPASEYGRFIGSRVEVSHQFGCKFNPNDRAALLANDDAANPIREAFQVKSVKIWSKPSTAQPLSIVSAPALAAPQTGAALGGLPAITTGTYVLNIDASQATDPISDRIGGNGVYPLGGAYHSTDTINGLRTIRMDANGGVSVRGQATARAQGAGKVVLFMLLKNRNPYGPSVQFLAQFARGFPMTFEDDFKASLVMSAGVRGGPLSGYTSAGRSYGSFINHPGVKFVSSQGYDCNFGQAEVITMTKSVGSDGTVVIGHGYGAGRRMPATSGGIAPSALAGFTELLLGAGRDGINRIERQSNILIGQVIQVAVPDNVTLSDADHAAVVSYLTSKWGAAQVAPDKLDN